MKTKLLLTFFLFVIVLYTGLSQVPQGFNYQAIATASTGNPITNQSIAVRIALQTTETGGTVIWEEQHTVTTNQAGLFSLVIGTGTKLSGSVSLFSDIPWNSQTIYLKTSVQYPGTTWNVLGAAKIWSVPYSLIADKANISEKAVLADKANTADKALVADKATAVADGSKITVVSNNDATTEALFEVKRQDGQTVFAVYPDAVNVYVPSTGTAKGSRGGFAIGGFDQAKGISQDYLRVTPDSVRIYIDNASAAKGNRGGFAIGGYGNAKGLNNMYFNLSPSTSVSTVEGSPQVLWYPQKNAFLAGNVRVMNVDSVGDYSTALGYWSRAAGNYSQAFGFKSFAEGDYSTAIGKKAIAGVFGSKKNAFALGNSTQATGEDSYAFGSGAIASGEKSFAFGSVAIDSTGHALTSPTTASGLFSTAIGMGAQATNTGSLAFGNSSLSKGYASLALGFYSTVSDLANYGVAIGYYSQSNGTYAQAFGLKAIAGGTGSLAVGPYATTGSTANYSGSFGYSARALGPYSVAIGYNATTASTASNGGAFGYRAIANGPYSVAVGPFTSTASASNYAGAFGYYAQANGVGSVAIGYNAKTTGQYAGALGNGAIANGQGSVAIGSGAVTASTATDAGSFGKAANATGLNSIAIGNSATTGASATDATALGKLANASGATSMALGISASSTGANSIAIGNNSISNAPNSTTLGSNSVTNATATYSTALGYGSSTGSGAEYATALGYNAQANGPKSISIGAYYNYSIIRLIFNPLTGRFTRTLVPITKNNIAYDAYSMAIGNGNTAYEGGLALGSNNIARKVGSVALGHTSTADSAYSVAAGSNAIARGYNAVAIGETVTAEAANSFVVGYNNITNAAYSRDQWVDTDPLFVVGNGGTGSASNAVMVLKNGNVKLPGLASVTTGTGYYLQALADGSIVKVTSSRRYKHDINAIVDYSWLYNLRPVDYLYNGDSIGPHQYGFIAEEVDKVNKELVTYKNGEPDAVNYVNIIAPIVKAVQDQKKTIETLQSENAELRTRLEKLESVVNALSQGK